jgi:ArsR family transcriptional regulator
MDLCSLARSFSALSDPIRLRLLTALRTRPATCSKELAELAGISVALASHHTKILEDAELITRRREGQFSLFSLNTERMGAIAEALGAAACPDSARIECTSSGEQQTLT